MAPPCCLALRLHFCTLQSEGSYMPLYCKKTTERHTCTIHRHRLPSWCTCLAVHQCMHGDPHGQERTCQWAQDQSIRAMARGCPKARSLPGWTAAARVVGTWHSASSTSFSLSSSALCLVWVCWPVPCTPSTSQNAQCAFTLLVATLRAFTRDAKGHDAWLCILATT